MFTFIERLLDRSNGEHCTSLVELIESWVPTSPLLQQVIAGQVRLEDIASVVYYSNLRSADQHPLTESELGAATTLETIFPMVDEVECFHLGTVSCDLRKPVEKKSFRRGVREHWFSILFTMLMIMGVPLSVFSPPDIQLFWMYTVIPAFIVGVVVAHYRQGLVDRYILKHRKSRSYQILQHARDIDEIMRLYRVRLEEQFVS